MTYNLFKSPFYEVVHNFVILIFSPC